MSTEELRELTQVAVEQLRDAHRAWEATLRDRDTGARRRTEREIDRLRRHLTGLERRIRRTDGR